MARINLIKIHKAIISLLVLLENFSKGKLSNTSTTTTVIITIKIIFYNDLKSDNSNNKNMRNDNSDKSYD